MSKRVLKLLCLTIIMIFSLAVILSGCGSDNDTSSSDTGTKAASDDQSARKVTLRYAYNWTTGDSKGQYYEPALKSYMEKNKDTVEISLEGTPGMEHKDKIKVDLAGNNLPDVFMYWTGEADLKPLVDGDTILDMDEFFSASKNTKKEQWNEGAFSSSKVGGKLFTLPVESFKGFFLCNKALFEKYKLQYPKTYAELKTVSKVFIENGIVPINMASKGGNPGHLFLNAVGYQLKDGWKDSQTIAQTKKYNTESNLNAAKIIDEMRKEKMFPSDTIANGDWGPAVALYNEQKAAMVYCFPWKIGDIKKEIADVSEVVPFPKMEGAELSTDDFAIGGVSMGVLINKKSFADASKKQAIIDFVDYLVSDAMFTELGKASMMPAKNVKLDASQLNALFVKAVDFTSTQKFTYDPTWALFPGSDTTQSYADALDELFAGAITPEQYVEKVQTAVDSAK